MKSTKILRAAAFTLTSAGLLVPQSQLFATTPAVTPVASQPAAPAVLDIALAKGGVLNGQVVDAQGQPVADAPVAVIYEGKEVAKTQTAKDGTFAVAGLHGGTHMLSTGNEGGLVRAWTPGTAPPAARTNVMLVRGGQVARGQGFRSGGGILMLGALGGIVAGGVVSQDSNSHSGS